MAHARLGIAQENSGKLVSLVRRQAKALCVANRCDLLICDGSPGIGCPVIASICGARMVLVVAEPTLSGLHDLKRVVSLCKQLNVEVGVCINKADLNPGVTAQIEAVAVAIGLPVLGRVRYDEAVTTAQVKRMAVVEQGSGPAAMDIRDLWKRVTAAIMRDPGGTAVSYMERTSLPNEQ
jgi:MinD superfamily P-loop ATPase